MGSASANKDRFAFTWKARGSLAVVDLVTGSAGAFPDDAPMIEQDDPIVDFDLNPFESAHLLFRSFPF